MSAIAHRRDSFRFVPADRDAEPLGQVEIDAPHLESPFGLPMQMWGTNPIVVTALGDVYVIDHEPPMP